MYSYEKRTARFDMQIHAKLKADAQALAVKRGQTMAGLICSLLEAELHKEANAKKVQLVLPAIK